MAVQVIPADVIAGAQAAFAKWKIPASVTIAQWAVESGWGRHMPPNSNNPFGIKALPGQPSVTVPTREVIDGKSVFVSAAFHKFASLTEAFDYHGRLLAQGKPYAKARAALPDPVAFANALTGVYATDPLYGHTLNATMAANSLQRFDKAPAPIVGTAAPAVVVLAPVAILAAHSHSSYLPAILGVSLALAVAWVVILWIKSRTHRMTVSSDIQPIVDAINADAALIATAIANAGTAGNAALQAQLDTVNADLATERQNHTDDVAALQASVDALKAQIPG